MSVLDQQAPPPAGNAAVGSQMLGAGGGPNPGPGGAGGSDPGSETGGGPPIRKDDVAPWLSTRALGVLAQLVNLTLYDRFNPKALGPAQRQKLALGWRTLGAGPKQPQQPNAQQSQSSPPSAAPQPAGSSAGAVGPTPGASAAAGMQAQQ